MLHKITRKPRQSVMSEMDLDKAHRGGVWAIYSLFAKYWVKAFFGPFFIFIFPLLILAILGSLMEPKYMFPGIVAMSAMSSGITGMPFAIVELKNSVLLKRIGASPVKASKFTFVVITFYTAMIFLSVAWLMLWLLILHQDPSMFDGLWAHNGASFFTFIYGNFLNIILSLSVGFVIASVARGEQQAQAIGMVIFMPSTFLAGQFISMDIVSQNSIMNSISMALPFRYTTMLIVGSWNGDVPVLAEAIKGFSLLEGAEVPNRIAAIMANPGAFPGFPADITTPQQIADFLQTPAGAQFLVKEITIYQWYEPIIGFIVPYVTIGALTWYSVKKFNWSSRR